MVNGVVPYLDIGYWSIQPSDNRSDHLFRMKLFSLELFLEPYNLKMAGLTTFNHWGEDLSIISVPNEWLLIAFSQSTDEVRKGLATEKGGLKKLRFKLVHHHRWNLTSCLFKSSISTSLIGREHKGQSQLKPKPCIAIFKLHCQCYNQTLIIGTVRCSLPHPTGDTSVQSTCSYIERTIFFKA